MEYIIGISLVILIFLHISDKLEKRAERSRQNISAEEAGVEIMDKPKLNDTETILIDRREYEELAFYREMVNNQERLEDADTNAINQG